MGLSKDHKTADLRLCWVAAGVVAAVAVLLQLGGKPVQEALAYERDAVASGQLWRLVTGHFVHLGWSHLLLNLLGLALVCWLVGHAFNWLRWLYIGLVILATMGAGFWFLYPVLDWYVGLSGLEHGLIAAGLLAGIVNRDREAMILACFVVAKLGWEQAVGPLPGSESTAGGAVIVDAHLYGAIGGVLGALLSWRSVRQRAAI